MKLVEDQSILAQLDQPAAPKPVNDPATLANLEYGIDVNRPVGDVRADMAKLTGANRERALNLWADSYVAKERGDGGISMAADNTARTLARGSFVGPFLDEATAASQKAMQVITGGAAGSDYDEALAYQRARDRAVDKEYPVLSTAGQLATGIGAGVRAAQIGAKALSPAGVVAGPISAITPAQSTIGRLGQAAGVGAGYGAVAGLGNAEGGSGDSATQAANRGEGALKGGILGGILGSAFGVAGEGIQRVARARANMGSNGAYGTIADDLPGGVNQLADHIAVGGTRANQAANRRTLDILGEEMERAGGNVPLAQRNTIGRIVQETGVSPTTAASQIRRLASVHETSNLTLGEYPAVAASDTAERLRQPSNINLDALGRSEASTTQAKLDYLANNGNAQSAQNVRNAISRRQEDLAPSMRGTLEGLGPQIQTGPRSFRPATIVDAEDMIDTARRTGSAEYQTAYNSAIDNQVALYWLPQLLDWHTRRASSRAGDIEGALNKAIDQFYTRTPDGQRVAMMTLQQLQDARGVLRGQIGAYRQSGRNDLSNAVQPLYEHITRLMSNMSPEWARANARWADMNFQRIGQDLGEAFSTRAGPEFRRQMREFSRLAPEAKDIVRIEFLQKLYDKLDNLPDTHAISKLFSNDHSRNAIGTLFGDEAAVAFTRAVRDQRVAESSQRMMANSATHRRGQAQKQMDAETGLVAAAENASVRGIRNWLIERAAQVLTENRNRPMAEILTTPMSDTARVAHHLHRMREQRGVLARYDVPSTGPMVASGAPSAQASRSVTEDAESRRKRTGTLGSTENRLLSQARNALLRGAPRADVEKRLRENGVDPVKLGRP